MADFLVVMSQVGQIANIDDKPHSHEQVFLSQLLMADVLTRVYTVEQIFHVKCF